MSSPKGVVWNLGDLYQGDGDPELDRDWEALRRKAGDFVATYRDQIIEKDPDPQKVLSAIRDYESIHEAGLKPFTFAYLHHSSDLRDQKAHQLYQKASESWNEISGSLTFFPLKLMALPEKILSRLAESEALCAYRYFFYHLTQLKPYTLSEPEERLIKSKNLSGRAALISLYDELKGSLTFSMEIGGKTESLTGDQIQALLYSPDRSVRERASRIFHDGLREKGLIFKHVLNHVILDHHLEDRRRGHPFPMHRVNLSNGTDEATVETMMGVVEEHYPLAQRFFYLKAQLLGLKKLKNTDLYAPLRQDAFQVGFSGAKDFVLEAMEKLHPLFHSIVGEFFEKRWIDGEVRMGKRGGGFCKCLAPSQHPYISMIYNGNLRDLMVLAHELGHGLHYVLAAGQSYLNFNPSPLLAETASTFSELSLIQHLMGREDFQDRLPDLMAVHIESIFITVFRQHALTRFEQAVHRVRGEHFLSEEEICELWWEQNERLYGDAVEMTPEYRWGWAHIPHFVHHPFYCYSYIFGNLVSIILFEKYREQGRNYLEDIIDLFRAGGSKSPLEMLQDLGYDPRRKPFWDQAFKYIKGLVDALEALNTEKSLFVK